VDLLESSDERRIVTLNIRHGGKKFADALNTRLLSYQADVLVVTEFRANNIGERLLDQLQRAGYATSHPGADSAQNSVLIASRSSIDRSWPFSHELDARHLWCVDLGWTVICAVYMPDRSAKLPYRKSVIDRGRRGGVDLFMGDFNTGNNDCSRVGSACYRVRVRPHPETSPRDGSRSTHRFVNASRDPERADEYDRIEYAGLPVKYAVFIITLCCRIIQLGMSAG
jgi:hypothetical protein